MQSNTQFSSSPAQLLAAFLVGESAKGQDSKTTLYSETALRVVAGLFLVPHGAQKLFGWFGGYGLEATGQFFENQLGFQHGFLMAFGAGFVEFFAGLALALGLFTRLSALGTTILLLVAASMHIQAGFFWTSGGYEYPVLWAFVTGFFLFKGGNSLSVDHGIRRQLKS